VLYPNKLHKEKAAAAQEPPQRERRRKKKARETRNPGETHRKSDQRKERKEKQRGWDKEREAESA